MRAVNTVNTVSSATAKTSTKTKKTVARRLHWPNSSPAGWLLLLAKHSRLEHWSSGRGAPPTSTHWAGQMCVASSSSSQLVANGRMQKAQTVCQQINKFHIYSLVEKIGKYLLR